MPRICDFFEAFRNVLLTKCTHIAPPAVKLNGNRRVTGVLRGFDQFMNVVLDEVIDAATEENIGMVVCDAIYFLQLGLISCRPRPVRFVNPKMDRTLMCR